MTASADKVQFLLENSLEETLPLVKKGVFSQQQLRQIMLERERCQNKLYSTTYKLSHFLKAIQFEYDLERQRLYRLKNQDEENVNPLFKKQGKTDFAIVRRIIKLWDRTMHKYRWRAYLWKQYLSFCITIKSKKHFYKALTNALRFLPFQVELWKIGVRYEVEVGRNMWKARKLFHKGLKLIPAGQKNIQLNKQLIKFELQFVETLQAREKIIKGQEEEGQNDMKFIIGENQEQESSQEQQAPFLETNQTSDLLKLKQYDQVLILAIIDSITKNCKSTTYFHNQNLTLKQKMDKLCDEYLQFLDQLKQNEQNQLLVEILEKTQSKVRQYKGQIMGLKIEDVEEKQEQMELQEQVQAPQDDEELQVQNDQQNDNVLIEEASEHCLLFEQQKGVQTQKPIKQLTKQQKYYEEIMQNFLQTNKFDEKLFVKRIKQFCLKPRELSLFLEPIFQTFFSESLLILQSNSWLNLPLPSLEIILSKVNETSSGSDLLSTYLSRQIQKINPESYIHHIQLLTEVIRFNRKSNKIEENNRLFRSLQVNCKRNIEFIERAKALFVE